MRKRFWLFLLALSFGACERSEPKPPSGSGELSGGVVADEPLAAKGGEEDGPAGDKDLPPLSAEPAPPPTVRLEAAPELATLLDRTATYFAGHIGRRIHVQTDKPLYKPGETIWFKVWDLRARDLGGDPASQGLMVELVSPKGSSVLSKRLQEQAGAATNDFAVPEEVQGGEYQLRITPLDGSPQVSRPVIISTYEPPRIKKKLEFVRKAYGPGDEVTATIKVSRPTGEPLASHPLRAQVVLDGEMLAPISAKTNSEGGALIRFPLPSKIERGDGLLTVLVDDGGITESVSKRVPIVLKRIQLAFFPEGGSLVAGIESRLYFEAKNTLGKPADVEGRIIDDLGNAVAELRTHHFGLGRVSFTPATGRRYHAEITKPVGIKEKITLPLAQEKGCVLRTFDDLDGELEELRVSVVCSEAQKLVVTGVLRENVLDTAMVQVGELEPAILYLKAKDPALAKGQGVARVTVFDEKLNPLAERVVFRHRRKGLGVALELDQESYSPREQVALTVRTTDPSGSPVSAEVGISVVDDTVVSFADDKTGHMLSKLLLEPEIPGEVEEPNFFFDLREKKSALAMDLLMGTRGYRRFEWAQVFEPPPPPAPTGGMVPRLMRDEPEEEGFAERPMRAPRLAADLGALKKKGAAPPPEPEAKEQARKAALVAKPLPGPPARQEAPALQEVLRAAKPRPMDDVRLRAKREAASRVAPAEAMDMLAAEEDGDWAGGKAAMNEAVAAWAPVRVFPAPTYDAAYSGPRTDFRETIHWAPSVRTGKNGKAVVTFYLSDAVTSFRVFAEGAGPGAVGRAEKTLKSSLPFSMSVKLPVEVSAGDRLLLPLTLSNERDQALPISLEASFGELLSLEKPVQLSGPTLAASSRESLFYPVVVAGREGKSKVSFSANAGGLIDEFVRELQVVPVGFPVVHTESGSLKDEAQLAVDVGDALEGTLTASIKLEASPVGTLLSGLDGMLQEPYGCFEQTSSTNYPNVMIMKYLRSNDVADPELIERSSALLDKGYKRLVGFETQDKGYEWFGRAPAHEALTAYGVLEFVDMKEVYGGVDEQMLARTVAWLKKRRDGKGGFLRDAQALDSFGRAAPEITDAYVMYGVTEAGFLDFDAEIEVQAKNAEKSEDPYLVALATNTLLNVPRLKAQAKAAAKRLAGMQQAEGGWKGKDHSVTRSTGVNLDVETTSLALLALMKAEGYDAAVRKGVEWLLGQRSGYGAFGATQATVLALKALTKYAVLSRKTQSDGTISVVVNGEEAGKLSYEAGRREPIVIADLGRFLKPGTKNRIDLVHTGGGSLPFSASVEYRVLKPPTHPEVVLDLDTRLARAELKMGETVRLTAKLINKTSEGQPMSLARIGLPGGLSFQTWQLKELKEKGLIAFYETRAREVILYFRDVPPSAVKEIPIDLVATVPGEYTGPASSAYLYYTNDKKVWADALKVSIQP